MTWSPRQQPAAPDAAPTGHKTCPNCAEHVRAEAHACRYCNHTFERRWYDPLGTNKALIIASLVAATFVLWATGMLDRPLSEIGLNRGTCAENLFGKTMCGSELVEFCRDHYGPTNRDTCGPVLTDEGIDPATVLVQRRERERAYEACVKYGGAAVSDC